MPPAAKTAPLLPAALGPYTDEERSRVECMAEVLREEVERADGGLPFDRYMELALYAPGLGYYVGGARTFGAAGDFVTAPDISPLFSRCLAVQCAEVLGLIGGGEILEIGAGAGTMAVDLLLELQRRDALPAAYRILELGAELRARQRRAFEQRAPALLPLVSWSDGLPEPGFRGVVLANEVLDAMPVHRFRVGAGAGAGAGAVEEMVVGTTVAGGFRPRWLPARSPGLSQTVRGLDVPGGGLAHGYASEVNLRFGPWLRALGERLAAGAALVIDYGYTAREYYHPERHTGTLICHFRHRAHGDPLVLPGLQDITASVDFSAVAAAGAAVGLELAGYATQAHFLLGCGLDQLLAASDPADVEGHLRQVQGVKLLTLPSEMGERFKVLGLTRGVAAPLCGFRVRDLRARL